MLVSDGVSSKDFWKYQRDAFMSALKETGEYSPTNKKQTIFAVLAFFTTWFVALQIGIEVELVNIIGVLTLIASLVLGVAIFISKRFMAPVRFLKALRDENTKLRTDLHSAAERLTTPILQPIFRDGDNRYLIVREEEAHGARLGTNRIGKFSISNPPDRARSVENVNVLLKDITGCGDEFRDVRLRFDSQSQADPIDINPGETKFIKFASFLDRGPGREDEQIQIYHAGQDGLSGIVSRIPRAEQYIAKIYISGRDIPLHPFHIVFGIRRGQFYISQYEG
jgi:hypothetical protein